MHSFGSNLEDNDTDILSKTTEKIHITTKDTNKDIKENSKKVAMEDDTKIDSSDKRLTIEESLKQNYYIHPGFGDTVKGKYVNIADLVAGEDDDRNYAVFKLLHVVAGKSNTGQTIGS